MAILVLDVGGVVYRSWPDAAFHARWAERCGCDAATLQERFYAGDDWSLADLGQISHAENIRRLAARLGLDVPAAREMVFEGWASQPDEALAELVGRLRSAGTKVAALTNNASTEAELLARPELARLFDLAISSADAGLAKPDPAFYRHAEARLGAAGAALVFVDDVEGNVEAARALGWRGVWFRSTDQAIGEIEAAFADKSPMV
ncbi:MAG TPA: HAD-IA family hydrolase [Caulobacteraceae bacterium]|nr:HAD-IA family hydrolase [Caulobacteraceae bacterium]